MAEYIGRDAAIAKIKDHALSAYDIDLDCSDQFAGRKPAEQRCEGLYEALECITDGVLAADVVEKEKYDRLLKAAKKMHTWIFLHTAYEQAAYDECGLTDEENALLGYGGKIEFHVGGKENG